MQRIRQRTAGVCAVQHNPPGVRRAAARTGCRVGLIYEIADDSTPPSGGPPERAGLVVITEDVGWESGGERRNGRRGVDVISLVALDGIHVTRNAFARAVSLILPQASRQLGMTYTDRFAGTAKNVQFVAVTREVDSRSAFRDWPRSCTSATRVLGH